MVKFLTCSGPARLLNGLAVSLAPLKIDSTGVDEGMAEKIAFFKKIEWAVNHDLLFDY